MHDLGFLAWRSVGLNLYGNSVITSADYLKTHQDLAKQFVQVSQRAFAACVADAAPCLDALFANASGLDRRVQEDQWQRIKELMASPEGKADALGWFNMDRVVSDYQLVQANIGFDKPFDPKEAATNALLDTGDQAEGVAPALPLPVMARSDPAVVRGTAASKMAGSSPAMTVGAAGATNEPAPVGH